MTDLTTSPAPAAISAQEIEELAELARAGKAASTVRSYEDDLRHFEAWGGTLPTTGDTLARWVNHCVRHSGVSVSAMSRRLAAVRAAHRAAGWPIPESAALRQVWDGARRTFGRPPERKAALRIEDLRRVLAEIPDTMTGKRDRALLLIGFAGALRRSELAALHLAASSGPDAVATLAFVPEGMEVRLARSKADQEGRGAVVAIPFGGDPKTCAVRAVRAWLAAAGIASGPVWRKVTRTGKPVEAQLSPQSVPLVIKAAVERVGLDPADFSGHSLRAGLITSAAANEAAPEVLMEHARHRSFDTSKKYIREGNRFKRNAARMAGL